MSNKKDIESYLKKNALKGTVTQKSKAIADAPPGPSAGKTTGEFGRDGLSPYIFYPLMFTSFFLIVLITVVVNNFSYSLAEKIILSAVVYAVVLTGSITAYFLRLRVYNQWVAGKHYPLDGWKEFIAARSRNFWDGPYFVNMKVSVHLSDRATEQDRAAVTLFMKKWEERWGKGWGDIRYESGAPDELKASGLSLSGDFNSKVLRSAVNTMGSRFVALAAMLGDTLTGVRITSDGKEKKYVAERDSDDGDERNRSWMSRHES